MSIINSQTALQALTKASNPLQTAQLALDLFKMVGVLTRMVSQHQSAGSGAQHGCGQRYDQQYGGHGQNGLSLPIFGMGNLDFDFANQSLGFCRPCGHQTPIWSNGQFDQYTPGQFHDLGKGLMFQLLSSGRFGGLLDQILFQFGQQQHLINGLGQSNGGSYTPSWPGYGFGNGQGAGAGFPSLYDRFLEYYALNHGPKQAVDGYGNNQYNPEWGQAHTELGRITPHRPGAFFDPTLPNPRDVSNAIFDQKEDMPNSHGTTHFVWIWGQFIDHDISLTSNKGEFVPIVGSDGRTIPFTRAGNTENEITSFIDLSSVYGSSEERLAALREGPDSPYLKLSPEGTLPYNTSGLENENGPNPNANPADFFLAGDVRANENPALTSMHLLFAKDHNKTAAQMWKDNPSMSAEQVWERTRQVMEAKAQKITYDEFLPSLGIKLEEYKGYDPSVDPTVNSEFSTAAFRFGHSAVGNVPLLDKDGKTVGTLELSEAFFNPDMAKGDALEQIMRGAANDLHQEIDGKIVGDLRDQLFIIRDKDGNPVEAGSDLAALNIARGRDQGLGTFNDHREAAGLQRYTSFEQISSDPKVVAQLKGLYKDVNDVDAWVGMLVEDDAPGSQLGATATKLIGNQFTALRDGDATYYKNAGVLTPYEMQLVENSSLSKLITDNSDIKPGELADNVFFHPDHQPETNPSWPPTPTWNPIPTWAPTPPSNSVPPWMGPGCSDFWNPRPPALYNHPLFQTWLNNLPGIDWSWFNRPHHWN